jgi:7,8-dihydropterin-6-yl-methyl-4-(beta-D-ribofuranosyl)aminobenzene 5'-phosphate synthase
MVRITIVVDNTADDPCLKAEHGLALWIEAGGLNILFDTGKGDALVHNARHLGLPLEQTDLVVISHGHYDHTGALAQVLALAPAARIILHPSAVVPRYVIRSDQPPNAIGMPAPAQAALDRLPAPQITWVARPLAITADIGITGPIPRATDFEDTGGPFFLDSQGQRADGIDDDQAMWIRSDKGLIVLVGCSHAGIVNTLAHIRHLSGIGAVHAVIGGFHLINADDRRIDQTLAALDGFAPEMLAPCHCTGDQAVKALRHRFGERLVAAHAGAVFCF